MTRGIRKQGRPEFRARWSVAWLPPGGTGFRRDRPEMLRSRAEGEQPMTQNGALSKNMRLLGHNDLGGFGNCGEGMAIQLARDGRRVLWLGHESAPKNFTAVDVTDPRKPSVIVQTDLPNSDMRSNNLDLVGDLLVVPYQTSRVGMKPAGVEFFDVTDPGKPRSVAFFDASGPHSRGVHHLWFVDGSYLHLASGAPDF